MMGPLLIEGYAALFGVPDTAGDVVRAGAFAQSLRQGRGPPPCCCNIAMAQLLGGGRVWWRMRAAFMSVG